MTKPSYIIRLLIALDDFVNTVFDGMPAETISSRCYRLAIERGIVFPMRVVNFIMCNKNHCYHAFMNDAEHRYSPPEER